MLRMIDGVIARTVTVKWLIGGVTVAVKWLIGWIISTTTCGIGWVMSRTGIWTDGVIVEVVKVVVVLIWVQVLDIVEVLDIVIGTCFYHNSIWLELTGINIEMEWIGL